MKQCPQCKRIYTDETLNFCLVDGEWLVGANSDDSPTAIIVPPAPTGEAPTQLLSGPDSFPDAGSPTAELSTSKTRSFTKRRSIWAAAAVVLIATAGLSYRYLPNAYAPNSIDSIAVLPFENASGDANADYISDGITESLIDSLSLLPNVTVISRASVFRYKGNQSDIAKIAHELGVAAVVTGRVIERDNKLDINVELTDIKNNSQLWGQRFPRDSKDIFNIPDEIARQVTDSLRLRLTGTQQDKVIKQYTTNPEAFRLYLQGRHFFNNFSEENLAKAIQFFDQAIALDPNYAVAYAARSECYLASGDLSLPMGEAVSKARHDSSAALAIDPELTEALTVQAEIKFQSDWDFAESEKDFRAAIASNPNYAEAHHQYAWYLAMIGKEDESFAEMRIAQQLDPVNPSISLDSCLPDSFARRWERCRDQSNATLQMFPNYYTAHMTLGMSLFNLGDQAGGIEELKKAESLEPTPHLVGTLGYYFARAGRKDEARKALADLEDMSKRRFVPAYWPAAVHIGLGEKDEAFSLLQRSYQERSWWLIFLKMDPIMESLHSDPRYSDLIHKIGYPN